LKKHRILLLALLVLLLAFLPSAMAVEEQQVSVFSVEVTDGAVHHGYLVTVRENISPRARRLSANVERVSDTLYVVGCMGEAKSVWQTSEIVVIEPNYEVRLFSAPNDILFPRQWDMQLINAQTLWDAGASGAGVRIAVIDSGVRVDHEDLDLSRIEVGFNYIANNTNVYDEDGHGTHIVGILSAIRDNRVGVAGLLDGVTIIPLQVFDGDTSPLSLTIRAINDAVDIHNADVINLSWGLYAPSFALEHAINHAASQGAIIVAAVGNDGAATYLYPAAFDNVIGVGAVGEDGQVAFFSQRNTSVFVTAPGMYIYTTGHVNRSYYVQVSGTSFSAPFVSAMAAVARQFEPDITLAEFQDVLRRSAVPQGSGGRNDMYGYGVIDMARFLAELAEAGTGTGTGTEPPPGRFTDIAGHWAAESILFVAEQGLFDGTGSGQFSPNQQMNRAMFVTVLGRLYGQMGGMVQGYELTFADASEIPAWARPYVAWASAHDIVGGVGDNRFAPQDPVTRQQMVTILARFSDFAIRPAVGETGSLAGFVDHAQVAGFATIPMAWAVERGIISGISVSGGMALNPTGNSTRAQVAVVLQRFVNATDIALQAAA